MMKFLPPLFFLALLAGPLGCSPAPPADIPRDAKAHWSLKGGDYWTWIYRVENGCVAWMAKPDWADVQVVVESRCEGQRELGYLEGKGLGYSSVSDYLHFRGYWPWTSKMWSDMLEFDDEGMLAGGNIHPCPYALTQDQIEAMRVVAAEALSAATTDGERRMLTRVVERLAATNGQALSSSQFGCTDRPLDPTKRATAKEVDPWTSK